MSREITDENLLECFEAHYVLEPNRGCWLWTGTLVGGYGWVNWAILGGKHSAHRLSWKLFRGPLTDDQQILHSCDVPHCVNPDHLFEGDHQINMDDRNTKGRQSKGENHGKAKLTEAQVIAIINDNRVYREIAFDYNVNPVTISLIKSGKSWEYLDRQNKIEDRSKGETHGNAKLTEVQAIAIINDQRTQHEIARDYGVARSLISHIKSGKKWKHLDSYRGVLK